MLLPFGRSELDGLKGSWVILWSYVKFYSWSEFQKKSKVFTPNNLPCKDICLSWCLAVKRMKWWQVPILHLDLWGLQDYCGFFRQCVYKVQVRVQSGKKKSIIKWDFLCVDHKVQRKMALTCLAELDFSVLLLMRVDLGYLQSASGNCGSKTMSALKGSTDL